MLGKKDIYRLLDERGIAYEAVEHPAVYTVEEADALQLPHPETGTKNLFLRDDKHRAYFLLTCREDVRVDLKALQAQIGSRRLSSTMRLAASASSWTRHSSAAWSRPTPTRTRPRSSCRRTTCSPSSRSTAHP